MSTIEWDEPLARSQGANSKLPMVTLGWRRGSSKGTLKASITISGTLAGELGWAEVKRVEVTPSKPGAHLRLIPAAEGWSCAGWESKKCLTVLVPLTWVSSQPRPAQTVAHSIEDGALILSLPEWARKRDRLEAQKPAVKQAATVSVKPVGGDVIRLDDHDRRSIARMLEKGMPRAAIAAEFGVKIAAIEAVEREIRAGQAAKVLGGARV